MQQPKAVLWDLDGTLIDSMEYHWLAWRDALAAENYELSRERFLSTFGWRNDEIMRLFFGPAYPLSEISRVGAAKEVRYRELVSTRGTKLLPGAAHWLEALPSRGWRQALATSAPPLNIAAVLGALGLAGRFDAVVSAEEVERGKPDPQIFLAAAAKLAVPPPRCVVVEDAPAGVEAARRAGMRSVGVLSTHDHLAADLVVKTLNDLPATAFDGLLASVGPADEDRADRKARPDGGE